MKRFFSYDVLISTSYAKACRTKCRTTNRWKKKVHVWSIVWTQIYTVYSACRSVVFTIISSIVIIEELGGIKACVGSDEMRHVSQRVLEEAVRKFCPVFYLCDDDSFGHPCSFDFFIQQSRLVCVQPECNKVLVDVGSLTTECLHNAICENCGEGENLMLQLGDPHSKFGEIDRDIDDIPVYAHVKGIVDDAGGAFEALEITYITLFAHNGPYTILPFLLQVGAHDGDIEHITVRVDPTGSKLIGVWYNAHRNHDGCWVAASEVDTSPDGHRICSFIAKHGHGHYPRESVFFRHFFLGNDVTKREVRWSPKNVVLLPTFDVVDGLVHLHHQSASKGSSLPDDDNECVDGSSTQGMYPNLITTDPCHWMKFRGFYGTAAAPAKQRWYHEAEPPISRHPILRLFFHFWPETTSLR